MKGTITGMLPNPAASAPSGATKTSWWKQKHTMTRRTLVGLALGAALLGGVVEKAGMDDKVADLQAQIGAMQDANSTGPDVQGTATVSKRTTGSANVQHPKALSPSQHKYQCTKVG